MREQSKGRKKIWSLLSSIYYFWVVSSSSMIHHLVPHLYSKQNITLREIYESISLSILTLTEASRRYSGEKHRKWVKYSRLSPDTCSNLRQSIAYICHAPDFASRLLPLIVTRFSLVSLGTSWNHWEKNLCTGQEYGEISLLNFKLWKKVLWLGGTICACTERNSGKSLPFHIPHSKCL